MRIIFVFILIVLFISLKIFRYSDYFESYLKKKRKENQNIFIRILVVIGIVLIMLFFIFGKLLI